ncbi:MAG: patatin-like phospholipase family protein [Rhodoferax sp.]|uniref:patatin-like phospholipase family protein n=1 Tax=Rhodoferax sp. TaxID=50421 RepID=UPI001401A634|nr:patatin-like phospholipase family protein [Rhodoferax sp.]NDP40237.1 patatin-like phospholipase family protein [Rhodoferax sp.]
MALIDGSTLGIALSGGGFRATLFGLGSLWRLNDAGLLGRLDRVTSVSGGSILAGVLASRWRELQFVDGKATNFERVLARPLQEFCSHTADIEAGILGWITPFRSAGDYLCRHYQDALFGQMKMHDLPPREHNATPLFVFYATNMQTGRNFRFRQDFIADYRLGINATDNFTLATAVTASSAFPPIFSPVNIKTDPNAWSDAAWHGDPGVLERLRRDIILADGGIYDNMGVESLNESVKLISDAGAPFSYEESPRGDYFSQLARVRDILIDQTRALRKRHLMEDFEAKRERGAYWGVGTDIGDYAVDAKLAVDSASTAALESMPTRLACVELDQQGRLINWGYALADAALRAPSRANLAVAPASTLPRPEFPLN